MHCKCFQCSKCFARAYVDMCSELNSNPDPSIWSAIFACSSTMEASQSGNPASLLPFLKLLCCHDIKLPHSLSLAVCDKPALLGSGDWICSLLRLRSMTLCNVVNLNLSGLGLTGLGIRDLAKCSTSLVYLKVLDLKNNYLSVASGAVFTAAFVRNSLDCFSVLDLSYNGLNTHDINLVKVAIECKADVTLRLIADENIYHDDWRTFAVSPSLDDFSHEKRSKFTLIVLGNYPYIELWNAISHGIGIALSILGIFDLLHISKDLSPIIRLACLIYGISALFLFVASTLYHSFFLLTTAKKVFKIIDHCAVFILIAGSYTPICAVLYTSRSDVIVRISFLIYS